MANRGLSTPEWKPAEDPVAAVFNEVLDEAAVSRRVMIKRSAAMALGAVLATVARPRSR